MPALFINGAAVDHVIHGGSASFLGVTLKLTHGQAALAGLKFKQTAVSASYSMDGLGLTAYYKPIISSPASTSSRVTSKPLALAPIATLAAVPRLLVAWLRRKSSV